MNLIECRDLKRTYRKGKRLVEAVKGVTFSVKAGEIVGFLGPNGAGKSTTQRMLVTLLDPTGGEARVAGHDLRREPERVRKRIGYVAQGGCAHPMATVDEELILQGRLHGMPASDAKARARDLCERLDLKGLGDRRTGSLSGGQRRRLDIALGLLHSPGLVFLDEPSTGLDPHSRANLWAHIREQRQREGTTLFLTTHYLDEADALCDRILILDAGRIVAEGSPSELKARIAGDLVILQLGAAAQADAAAERLRGLEGVREVAVFEGQVRATVDQGDRRVLPLMKVLGETGVEIQSVQMSRPTLDDVFLTLTGHSLRDAEEAA
jgi:ABC-2 type transport system ATP-binding protein